MLKKSLFALLLIALAGCGDLNQTVSSITVTPANPSVGINKYKQFSAQAYSAAGTAISSVSFAWSVSNSLATIDSNGLIAAGGTTGSVAVSATASGVTGSTTATIVDTGIVAGTLSTSGGGTASNVTVFLTSLPSLYAGSDSNGAYSIAAVPAGTCTVQTHDTLLYASSSTTTAVSTGETASANITLTDRVAIASETIGSVITGTIINNGTTEATGVIVSYILSLVDGTPASAGSTTVGAIAAGSTVSFAVIPVPVVFNYASYQGTVAATGY
ncbi:hypothetical protein ACFL52_01530 [Candidatus Margulisiibacteriota bacterium]